MPFQSEAQRRYLWANEPEIARDWTDTYGSKIHAADGGIMRTGFFTGMREQEQKERAAAGSKQPGHGGSSQTPAYHAPATSGAAFHHGADTQQQIETQRQLNLANIARQTNKQPDVFEQSWTGQPGIFGIGGGYQNLNVPGNTGAGHQSRFGIGNLFRGAMGMFGGLPGRIGSMLSYIDPRQLRGINSLGGYNTQKQYEDARKQRINEKRIANILRRKAPITKAMQERLASLGYTGDMPGVGSTGTSRAIDRDDFDINARIQDTSFEQNLPENMNTYNDMIPGLETEFFNQDQPGPWNNFRPGGIMEIDTETTEELLPENDPFAGDAEESILEKAKRINAEIKKPWAEKVDTHPATGESVYDKFPGRPLEWLYGLPSHSGTFIRDYEKRNEPYPFIDYIPNAEDIYKKRFP